VILTSVFIVSLGIGVGTLSRKRRKTHHRRGADDTIPMTTVFGDSAYGESAEDEADGSCFNLDRFVGACCGNAVAVRSRAIAVPLCSQGAIYRIPAQFLRVSLHRISVSLHGIGVAIVLALRAFPASLRASGGSGGGAGWEPGAVVQPFIC
jgi:hypothetical protein